MDIGKTGRPLTEETKEAVRYANYVEDDIEEDHRKLTEEDEDGLREETFASHQDSIEFGTISLDWA